MADIYTTSTEDIDFVEYKVRRVERFVVTRFQELKNGASGVVTLSEHPGWDTAFTVAEALAKQEASLRGMSPFDERMRFPGPMEDEIKSVRKPTLDTTPPPE